MLLSLPTAKLPAHIVVDHHMDSGWQKPAARTKQPFSGMHRGEVIHGRTNCSRCKALRLRVAAVQGCHQRWQAACLCDACCGFLQRSVAVHSCLCTDRFGLRLEACPPHVRIAAG
jgi:hypothetical protein